MRFNYSPFEYNGELLRTTNHELRPFLGLRCEVPPRQTHEINAVRRPQMAVRRWPSAMAPLIGELSAKLTERLIGCFLGLICGVAATDL